MATLAAPLVLLYHCSPRLLVHPDCQLYEIMSWASKRHPDLSRMISRVGVGRPSDHGRGPGGVTITRAAPLLAASAAEIFRADVEPRHDASLEIGYMSFLPVKIFLPLPGAGLE